MIQFLHCQTVYTVDARPESEAQFNNLQEAIDFASPGDIIYVHHAGFNGYGSITIDKTITLKDLNINSMKMILVRL